MFNSDFIISLKDLDSKSKSIYNFGMALLLIFLVLRVQP